VKTRFHQLFALASTAAAILALAGFATLSGCHDSGKQVIDQKHPAPVPALTPKVTVLGWHDYMATEALDMFTEATGIEVEYVSYESSPALRGMLESEPGRFDVIIADEASVAELSNLRLLQPINAAQVPLRSNLDERYLNLSHDPGNQFSIPYVAGITIVAYRSDKVQPKEESWSLLWDPAVKGHAVMLEEMKDLFATGLLVNGHSPNTRNTGELSSAVSVLERAIRETGIELSDSVLALDRMVEGDVWAMQIYNGDAVYAASELCPEISYFIPKKGARIYIDSFALPRDGQNADLAHAFINYMQMPETAALNSGYVCFATPNKAALPLVSEDLRNNPIIYPPAEVLAKCKFLEAQSSEQERFQQLAMRQLISTARENGKPSEPEEAPEKSSAEAAPPKLSLNATP